MKAIILSICLVLSTVTFSKEMAVLKKGDAAPFDGVLSDSEQMKEFRQINEENKLLKLENLKLSDLSAIQGKKEDLYKLDIDNKQSQIVRLERREVWLTAGAFLIGVIATSIAAKAAIESTR